MRHRLLSLAVLIFLAVFMILPVLAQDAPGETPTPGEVGDSFIVWLESLFLRGVGGGALVYSLTQIIKLFVTPEQFPARYIQLAVAVAVWVILMAGRGLGFDRIDSVYTFLEAILPHILALLTSVVTSGGTYVLLRSQGVPGLGYSRSKP